MRGRGGYQRDRKCGLDICDFAKLFSAFCLCSYKDRQFSFSESQAINYIKRASSLVHVDVLPQSFLADLVQAVCLLLEDGMSYLFAHRSFQEYFTARCIVEAPTEYKKRLMECFSEGVGVDMVIALLHEMQPEYVEVNFVLPELERILSEFKVSGESISYESHYLFLKKNFNRFEYFSDGIMGFVRKESEYLNRFVTFSIFQCGYLVGFSSFSGDVESCDQLFQREYPDGVSTDDLSEDSLIIRSLYEDGKWFGVSALKIMWGICEAIREKRKLTEREFDDLFVKGN